MPRTGRPREFNRGQALGAAMRLFWRQGYESTSLDHLKQAMGELSTASFYGAFGSKEQLFREALEQYLGSHGQVVAPLHDPALGPREALEAALRRSARMQTEAGLPGGCMVVLSATNMSAGTAHLQAVVAVERGRTRDGIRRRVAQAIKSGELRPGADATGLATLAEALLLGISVQSRDGVTGAAMEAAVSSLLQLWDMNRAPAAPPPPG